jgi:hypothetical protein
VSAATAGCLVIESITSDPAGVIARPWDEGWFVIIISAVEANMPTPVRMAAAMTTSDK